MQTKLLAVGGLQVQKIIKNSFLTSTSAHTKDTEDTASTFATSFDCISSALMAKETLPVERITDSTCGCDPQNCRVQPSVAIIGFFPSIEVDSRMKQFLSMR